MFKSLETLYLGWGNDYEQMRIVFLHYYIEQFTAFRLVVCFLVFVHSSFMREIQFEYFKTFESDFSALKAEHW